MIQVFTDEPFNKCLVKKGLPYWTYIKKEAEFTVSKINKKQR